MEKEATHYTYINGQRAYLRLDFDLHTNIPRWLRLKNGIWHVVMVDMVGLNIIEVKK